MGRNKKGGKTTGQVSKICGKRTPAGSSRARVKENCEASGGRREAPFSNVQITSSECMTRLPEPKTNHSYPTLLRAYGTLPGERSSPLLRAGRASQVIGSRGKEKASQEALMSWCSSFPLFSLLGQSTSNLLSLRFAI